MSLFHYPKSKHVRKFDLKVFKRYRTYTRYLQFEFERTCVYCRQPDSSSPNLNFGVDHYRPKGIARFADLTCEYSNLYYCCGNCNSRKNNYWPTDEDLGPYILNPCDHVMAKEIRFNSSNGKIEAITKNGRFTEELLQLNHVTKVQYRLGVLTVVRLYEDEIAKAEVVLVKLNKKFKRGEISSQVFASEQEDALHELSAFKRQLQSHNGQLPLPLPRQQVRGMDFSRV